MLSQVFATRMATGAMVLMHSEIFALHHMVSPPPRTSPVPIATRRAAGFSPNGSPYLSGLPEA